jgi:hypothetical protein
MPVCGRRVKQYYAVLTICNPDRSLWDNKVFEHETLDFVGLLLTKAPVANMLILIFHRVRFSSPECLPTRMASALSDFPPMHSPTFAPIMFVFF